MTLPSQKALVAKANAAKIPLHKAMALPPGKSVKAGGKASKAAPKRSKASKAAPKRK